MSDDNKKPNTGNESTVYSPKPAGDVEKVNPQSGDTNAESVKPNGR